MKPPAAFRRQLAALRDRVSLPVLFLAGVIALTGVLAYEAQYAARSSVARAEATLRDYSAFAATEYARQLRTNVFTTLRLSLANVPAVLNFRNPPLDPGAAQVRRLVLLQRQRVERGIPCDGCLAGVRWFFRVGVADDGVDFAPADSLAAGEALPAPELRRWLRDTVLRQVPLLADSGRPTVRTMGTVDAEGRPRGFSYFISNDNYVMVIGTPDGVPRLVGFVLARDGEGAALAAYGYEADPEAWLRPLLVRSLREELLLPPSLLRDLRNEEALAVLVSDGVGHSLYRSSERFDDRYAAADSLPARYGSLGVRVAVFPEIADQLLVGGLPRSRLPLLLVLFTLTVGLAAVAILQTRRQQELARLRTDFVSSVSHELRTPLAQIRWFAELLRMGRLRSDEERDRSLRIIDQEARRLAFLVENVLNFSRAGQVAGRLAPEPADLSHEVREVVDGFLPLAQARRVSVEQRLEQGATGVIDRGALRQILLNLLDNAVKYGPVGQTVTVGVERIATGHVRLWVEDEGPGVPEAERERVWAPFYRSQRELGSAVAGSGIGLSVVADLVALQDGRRWIERGATGGARVVLEFPSAPAGPADEVEETVQIVAPPPPPPSSPPAAMPAPTAK